MTYPQLNIPCRIAQGIECQAVYETMRARQVPKVMPTSATLAAMWLFNPHPLIPKGNVNISLIPPIYFNITHL
jgi:hypothetical protein